MPLVSNSGFRARLILLFLAAFLCLNPANGVANPAPEPSARLAAIIARAEVAIGRKNFPRAKKDYAEASALIAANDLLLQDFGSLLARVTVSLRTAHVLGIGKLGNPCPSLDASMADLRAVLVYVADHPRSVGQLALASNAGNISGYQRKFGCDAAAQPLSAASIKPPLNEIDARIFDKFAQGTSDLFDHAPGKAYASFRAAEVLMEAYSGEYSNFIALVDRTFLALNVARAQGAGGVSLGDPCRSIKRSWDLLAQVRVLAQGRGEETRQKIGDRAETQINDVSATYHCSIVAPKGNAVGK
jgi:hypothetical protein